MKFGCKDILGTSETLAPECESVAPDSPEKKKLKILA
jgi:hypothetical protein